MGKRDFLARFAFTFATALAVNLVVVYLWDLLADGGGMFHWYRSLTIALLIALFVALASVWKRR